MAFGFRSGNQHPGSRPHDHFPFEYHGLPLNNTTTTGYLFYQAFNNFPDSRESDFTRDWMIPLMSAASTNTATTTSALFAAATASRS